MLGDFLFFFFKQKTAYEITYGDWSSDVCSSDMCPFLGALQSLDMCPGFPQLKQFRCFGLLHSFAICPYLLQLKHFNLPCSSLLGARRPISMGCPLPPYVIPDPVHLSSLQLVDSYPCPIDMMAFFHPL